MRVWRWLGALPHRLGDAVMGWLNRYARWVNERERRWVEHGHDVVAKSYLGAVPRAVFCIGLVIVDDELPGVWAFIADVVIGALVGGAVLNMVKRMAAYRSGWLEGRQRMLQMATEHEQRGSTPQEWLEAEVNHDAVIVLGMPAIPPQRRPGP